MNSCKFGKVIKLLYPISIFLVLIAPHSLGDDDSLLLSFYHTHTHEKFSIKFRSDGNYLREELQNLNRFLRDFRTGETQEIDIALLEILHLLKIRSRSKGNIEIISAYRSSKTNDMLRKKTTGVVKNSLHLQGRALDIRFSDVNTKTLHQIARSLGMGGVGYYPRSKFIHIDVGQARNW